MRFTIAREKLQEALTAVTASVPAKTTLPVLANLLVETTDRGIRLSGTDLDMAVSTEVSADVDAAGAITIPAKKLAEIVRELPSAPVKVSAAGEQKITLECSRSRFRLLGLPRDEFPSFPAVRFDESWRIRSGELQKLISHTAFAASTEESRPILNGVLWELRADRMRMVATNGHRLAKMEVPISAGGSGNGNSAGSPGGDLIVPPKALEQIRRLFPAEEELEIARGDNHLGFRSPFTAVYTRLIEGPYPNYEQVIPKDNDRIAMADKNALLGALRRMSVIASDQTHRIRMAFNAGMLKFSVQTPDLGEAQDELPISFEGDPLEVGFNATYLLEVLRYMPTDEVRMTFKHPERAATIEPAGWDDPAKYLCLVMPLRLVD
jgi:DNA polymerase-3 subunit beta